MNSHEDQTDCAGDGDLMARWCELRALQARIARELEEVELQILDILEL